MVCGSTCRFMLVLVACCTGALLPSLTFPSAQALTAPCTVKETGDGRTPLCLLALFPYPDENPALQPSWDAGADIFPVLELAVELINNDTSVLKDYVLGLAHDDSGCELLTKTATSFVRSVIGTRHEHPIVGIIGPGCSASALTVLPLSVRPKIALLTTHIGGSPLLEDRALYPYGYSLLDSTYRAAESLFVLMNKNNWKRVAILYEEARVFFRTTFQAIESAQQLSVAFPEGAEISFSAGVSDSYIPLGVIKSKLIRVIVLLAGPTLLQQITCLGYHRHNLLFPAYQWVLVSRYVSEINTGISFTYEGRRYSCTKEEMLTSVLKRSVLLSYKLTPVDNTAPTVSGLSYNDYIELYDERVAMYNSNQDNPYVNISVNVWATTVFDAVWAQVLAMNNSNVNLSEYSYGNPDMTDLILDEFPKLHFEGVSGKVVFDNATGFTNRIFDIVQLVDGTGISIAYVDDGHLVILDTTAVFIDDSFGELPRTVHPAVAAIVVLLITIQLVVVVASHILTVRYRNYPSVKASSPRINQLIFLGVYMILAALYMYAIYKAVPKSDDTTAWLCQTLWAWLISPGFTLTFGPIIARTWRLYRIFTHFTNPGGFLLSELALIGIVGVLLLPDILIATVWTAIDPFKVEITDEVVVDEGLGQTIELELSCTCDYYIYWFAVVYGYKAVLMIVMLTLSQLTRNILSRDFTTKTLRVLIYILAITFVLGGSLYYILAFSSLDIHIDYIVLCLDLNIVVLLCIVLVFLPPLQPLLKEKYGKASYDIKSKMTGNSSSSSLQPLRRD